mgnify:CR=1 FL=1
MPRYVGIAVASIHSHLIVEQPVREVRISGFSNAGSGILPNTVILHSFNQRGRTARVLFAMSGHKIAVQHVPSEPTKQEIKLERAYFVDRTGAKLSKNDLAVHSVALLPLRKLMLLGTEDGLVRVLT